MKKNVFLFLIICGLGLLFMNGENCLDIDYIDFEDEEVARVFAWDEESCIYEWRYNPKEGSQGEFTVENLKSKHDGSLLLQFAGPFTNQDGSTQGVSVLDGEFFEENTAGYSGVVIVDGTGINLEKRFGEVESYFDMEKSGFEQALMVDDGQVSEQVSLGWDMYKENKPLNYRFLVEDEYGEVYLVDFYRNTGLKDSLNLLVEYGFKKAVYLDIVGSELGYYYENRKYKKLGGGTAINLYKPKSPGGFLELYVLDAN